MDVAYLSALSALAGSVVGGLTTGFTTWISQRSQAEAVRRAADLLRRQDLFRDFITAASKYGDAAMSGEPKIQEIVALWAMVSRMRILCWPATVARVDQIMHLIMDTFFEAPKTTKELHELMRKGVGADPLLEFSEAAREELRAFTL